MVQGRRRLAKTTRPSGSLPSNASIFEFGDRYTYIRHFFDPVISIKLYFKLWIYQCEFVCSYEAAKTMLLFSYSRRTRWNIRIYGTPLITQFLNNSDINNCTQTNERNGVDLISKHPGISRSTFAIIDRPCLLRGPFSEKRSLLPNRAISACEIPAFSLGFNERAAPYRTVSQSNYPKQLIILVAGRPSKSWSAGDRKQNGSFQVITDPCETCLVLMPTMK